MDFLCVSNASERNRLPRELGNGTLQSLPLQMLGLWAMSRCKICSCASRGNKIIINAFILNYHRKCCPTPGLFITFLKLKSCVVRNHLQQKLLQLWWTINKLAVSFIYFFFLLWLFSITVLHGILGLFHYSQIKNVGQ